MDAKYVMVLPSVGYEESVIGEPVGGINADFFKKLFELAQIDKNEVYFTSVVRCTGEPKAAEIKACQKWLIEEFKFLPSVKTIYTFGALPTRILLGLKTTFDFAEYVYRPQVVNYVVGQHKVYFDEDIHHTLLVPVYNPSYVIQRSQKEFDTLVENIVKGK